MSGVQAEMELNADDAPAVIVTEAKKWPASLAERATLLRELLSSSEVALPLASIATAFKPKLIKKKLAEAEGLLDTLVALGQAELTYGIYLIGRIH